MSIQKPTLRQNGTRLATIKVDFYVGRSHLIFAVAGQIQFDEMEPTRANVEKDVRLRFYIHGDSDWIWSDQFGESDSTDLGDRAAEIVDRLFPEFRED